MATGFKIGGEGDLDQIYVSPAEIQALQDEGRLTLQIQTQYGERRLWLWGDNSTGQLGIGLGLASPRSSPVQVGSLTNWKSVDYSSTAFALATKTDGTLWAWGEADLGKLGIGAINPNRSSPVQVGLMTDWRVAYAALEISMAIKTDGTLWAWGNNTTGRLGLGDTSHRSSPVQVGSLTNWSQLSVVASGALAIKTDGTLWAWGVNTNGRLGLGDNTTTRSSPVQVGSLTTWAQVSTFGHTNVSSYAVKTDGTLWAWGDNASGQLGLGDTTPRSSPVQVGSLTNWSKVSAGDSYAMAIKTDGTLWAWGDNATYGMLGLGDTTPRSSPVQVGSLTNWRVIWANGYNVPHTLAIKTDGTLWGWGYNAEGQLGLGDTTPRSSPVQIGTHTDWIAPYLRQS